MKRLIWILLPLFLSGCVVSKKKYEAMVDRRDHLKQELSDSQKENKNLNNKLERALADFESMKYELHKSNALKSDTVMSLMEEAETLKGETERLQNELASTRRKFESQQATSSQRENELEDLKSRVNSLITDTASLNHALEMSEKRQERTGDELNKLQDKYNDRSAEHSLTKDDLDTAREKISTLEDQLVEKEQTISNISDAFIELRKQLLSARSEGTPIDPNENNNIERIARLLEHY
ncbi:MAG: hypothetical protein ACOCPW_02695 [Marinilabiliaceae bacterium]